MQIISFMAVTTNWCDKRLFLSHLYIKTIIARDKYIGLKKVPLSCSAMVFFTSNYISDEVR